MKRNKWGLKHIKYLVTEKDFLNMLIKNLF